MKIKMEDIASAERVIGFREEDKVKSKAALLSADEYVLAGGGIASTVNNYLVKDYNWWTMSPAAFDGFADVNFVHSGSLLRYNYIDSSYEVRPVITLKATTTINSGSGTSAKPYVIG